jgi:hypothetical protein
MTPFEELIKELGKVMDLQLLADQHESCRLEFTKDLAVQIDLTPNADHILLGSDLGSIHPGAYRDKILKQALLMNGQIKIPKGVLAFSQKKDSLVLFQFLPLANLNGEKLYRILQHFIDHGNLWVTALKQGDLPLIEEETSTHKEAAPFGLR